MKRFVFRSVWDSGLVEPKFLVPGMVAERSITLVFGERKVGKGYWLLSQVIMPVAYSGRRVYLVALEDKHIVPVRAEACVKHYEESAGLDLGDTDFSICTEGSLDLLDRTSLADCLQHVRPCDLFVVDPLRIALGNADEDGSSTPSQVVSNLRWFIERVGCAVVLVAHTGYGNKDRPRGSSAWLDLTDISIRLHWRKGLMVAENATNRYMKRWGARAYESVDVGRQRVIISTDKEVPKAAVHASAEDRDDEVARAIWDMNERGINPKPAAIAEVMNMKVNIVNKSLGRLRKDERVVSDGGAYTVCLWNMPEDWPGLD